MSRTSPCSGSVARWCISGRQACQRSVSANTLPRCPTSTPVWSNPANVGRFGNAGLDTSAPATGAAITSTLPSP